jgi:hypothetical protein
LCDQVALVQEDIVGLSGQLGADLVGIAADRVNDVLGRAADRVNDVPIAAGYLGREPG